MTKETMTEEDMKEERARALKAFADDYTALCIKHGMFIEAVLDFKTTGIVPTLQVRPKKPKPPEVKHESAE